MSDHVRKQIRKAAKAALMDLPITQSNVFESRVYPLAKPKLPCLLIYSPSEGSSRDESPTDSMRDLTVMVYGLVRVSEKLEDELDDVAFEVEKALDDAGLLGGIVKNYHGIQNTETTLAAEDADFPHGAIEMEFSYTYRTRSGEPGVAI